MASTPCLFVIFLFLPKPCPVLGLCSTCLKQRCYDHGECFYGCVPGYVGEYCDEDCPSRCLNKECHLDRISGTVTCTDGCVPGYCGTKCTDPCPGGCETCDRQCAPDSCNVTLCPERRYGVDCSGVCSPSYETCDRETGECIRCRRGYYGDECNTKCLACFTRADDIVDNCLSGCQACPSDALCPSTLYGGSCELGCSTGCKSPGECNRATGECSNGCVYGYHGLTCNYTCREHCQGRTCHQTTGECSAGCVSGYHGLDCNFRCSKQCLGKNCDQTTGYCSAGCVLGYHGTHCDQENNTLSPNLLAFMITICLIVCAYLFMKLRRCFKSRRQRKTKTEYDDSLQHLLPDHMEDTTRKLIEELQTRTTDAIEKWTKDKIHVSAVDTVVDMLQRGTNWVTITGNAGDGKTTLGNLVLKQLKGQMRVFYIFEPKEYSVLSRLNQDHVIMFDDSFGTFTSDQVLIKKWKYVLTTIHKQFDHSEQHAKVIFVSRKNVLNEARNSLVHFQETLFESVVDLSAITVEAERVQILDYYLDQNGLTELPEVKQRVAAMDIAHGFPHCSKMYSEMKRHNDVDIEDFFSSPKEFLDITTTHLYNTNCKELFQLMIKNKGKFDVHSVDDDDRRQSLLQLKREQEGSYITVWKNEVCKFAHPSIYESILSVISQKDPLFVVKYATRSFLRQKITLTSEEKQSSPTQINVKPVPHVLKALAERFQEKILLGHYYIYGHIFCENEDFVSELLSSCVSSGDKLLSQDPQKQHINATGIKGRTMLWNAAQGGRKSAVLALMEHGADVNIPDESGNTPLLHQCKRDFVDFEMIKLLVTTGKSDCNIQDARGMAVLHFLCGRKTFAMKQTQLVVSEGQGDINQGDENGTTPLHWLCGNKSASLDEVKQLIEVGQGNVTKTDDFGLTSLHLLCRRNAEMETCLSKIHADKPVMEGDLEEFWFNPTYERSLGDLVFKLQLGDKWIPLLGPIMTLSREKIHSRLQVEDDGRELTNKARSGERPGQFFNLCGTCSSYVTFPPCPSTVRTSAYWETLSNLAWKEGKEKVSTPLEIGVVEGRENLDKAVSVSQLPGSTSVCVEADCHLHPGLLCIQVWKRDQVYTADQVGECITLSAPTPGMVHNVTLGLVLDVARGRVAFIDLEKGKLLSRIDQKFTQEVIPMFAISPLNDRCAIRMKLVSGREISITEEKKELIRQALSD